MGAAILHDHCDYRHLEMKLFVSICQTRPHATDILQYPANYPHSESLQIRRPYGTIGIYAEG